MTKLINQLKIFNSLTNNNNSVWNYFKNIQIITIHKSKFLNLRNKMKNFKINNYTINLFSSFKKRSINKPVKKQSLIEIMRHSYCDKICNNIRNCHFNLFKKLIKENKKYSIIFEDDIIINKKYINNLNNIYSFIKQHNNWDLFYLGYAFSYPFSIVWTKNIVQLNVYGSHTLLYQILV